MVTEKLLTLEEAAELLRRKPRFARRLVSERLIRFVYVGRTPYIPASAVDEYIEAHTVEPVVVHWRGGKAA
jgi:excisionase family DNA binding protein